MVGLIKNIDADAEDVMAENPFMFVISRKEWGAHLPTGNIPRLLHPLNHIRFTHTGTKTCDTHDECKKLIKKIQYDQMDTLGHKDITYNFMIGAQGGVYEGRGWEVEPERPSCHGDLELSSLEVAYIGDFEETAPPAEYLRSAMELIVYAVRTKILNHYFEGLHLI